MSSSSFFPENKGSSFADVATTFGAGLGLGVLVGGLATGLVVNEIKDYQHASTLAKNFGTIDLHKLVFKNDSDQPVNIKTAYQELMGDIVKTFAAFDPLIGQTFKAEMDARCFGEIKDEKIQLKRLDVAVRGRNPTDDKGSGRLQEIQNRFDAYYDEKDKNDEYTAMVIFLQNIVTLIRDYVSALVKIPGNDTTRKLEKLQDEIYKFIALLPLTDMFLKKGLIDEGKRDALLGKLQPNLKDMMDEAIKKQKNVTALAASQLKQVKIESKLLGFAEFAIRVTSLRGSDIKPNDFLMCLMMKGISSVSAYSLDNMFNENELFPHIIQERMKDAYLFHRDDKKVSTKRSNYFNDLMNMGNKRVDPKKTGIELPKLAGLEDKEQKIGSINTAEVKANLKRESKAFDDYLRYMNIAAAMQADLSVRLGQRGIEGLIETGEYTFRKNLIDIFYNRANDIYRNDILKNGYITEYLQRNFNVVKALKEDRSSLLQQFGNLVTKKVTGDTSHFLSAADIGKTDTELLATRHKIGEDIGYDIVCMRVANYDDIKLDELIKKQEENGKPILIKCRDANVYYIYGYTGSKWELRMVDIEDKYIQIIKNKFESTRHNEFVIGANEISQDLRNEFQIANLHIQGLVGNDLEHFRALAYIELKEKQVQAIDKSMQQDLRYYSLKDQSEMEMSNEYIQNIALACQGDTKLIKDMRDTISLTKGKKESLPKPIAALENCLNIMDEASNIRARVSQTGNASGLTVSAYEPRQQKLIKITLDKVFTTYDYSSASKLIANKKRKFSFFVYNNGEFKIRPVHEIIRNKADLIQILKEVEKFKQLWREEVLKKREADNDPFYQKLNDYSKNLEQLKSHYDTSPEEFLRIENENQQVQHQRRIDALEIETQRIADELTEHQNEHNAIIKSYFENSRELFKNMINSVNVQLDQYRTALSGTDLAQGVEDKFRTISDSVETLMKKQNEFSELIKKSISHADRGTQLAETVIEQNKNQLRIIEEEFKTINTDVPQIISELSNLMTSSIKGLVEKYDEKIKQANKELDDANNSHQQAIDEKNKIQEEQSNNLTSELDIAKDKKTEAENQLNELRKTNETLNSKIANISDMLTKSTDKSQQVSSELAGLMETVKGLLDNTDVSKEYKEIETNIVQLTKKDFEPKDEQSLLKITVGFNNIKAKVNAALAVSNTIITKIQDIIKISGDANTDVAAAQKEVSGMTVILAEQKSQIDKMGQAIIELQIKLTTAKETIQKLELQKAELQVKASEAQVELLKISIEDHKKFSEDLKQVNAKLLMKTEVEHQTLKEKSAETQTVIAGLKKQDTSNDSMFADFKAQNEAIKQSNERIQKELALAHQATKAAIESEKNHLIAFLNLNLTNLHNNFESALTNIKNSNTEQETKLNERISQSERSFMEVKMKATATISSMTNPSRYGRHMRKNPRVSNKIDLSLPLIRKQCLTLLNATLNVDRARLEEKGDLKSQKLKCIKDLITKLTTLNTNKPIDDQTFFNTFFATIIVLFQNRSGNSWWNASETDIGQTFINILNTSHYRSLRTALFGGTTVQYEDVAKSLIGATDAKLMAVNAMQTAKFYQPDDGDTPAAANAIELTVEAKFDDNEDGNANKLDSAVDNIIKLNNENIALETLRLGKDDFVRQINAKDKKLDQLKIDVDKVKNKITHLSNENSSTNPFLNVPYVKVIQTKLNNITTKLNLIIQGLGVEAPDFTEIETRLKKVVDQVEKLEKAYDTIKDRMKNLSPSNPSEVSPSNPEIMEKIKTNLATYDDLDHVLDMLEDYANKTDKPAKADETAEADKSDVPNHFTLYSRPPLAAKIKKLKKDINELLTNLKENNDVDKLKISYEEKNSPTNDRLFQDLKEIRSKLKSIEARKALKL